ncbi:MAG: biopolymer transporter ExbD [Sediminibacterium sp.]|jgi:biopolymer transport protein ExbD|uniref:ExbD/TolR family protein n=1 Tax=Sediminibacterium sp. TaxID=1917865 RepID=UPI00202CB622|nr:biopolymer transporter ExbD [Sediminibacterium sp.]MDZ4072583.1 biopolymer transporter ExbD [Sediminibacterium sp.]
MGRAKLPRKSTNIDMTAMCDVAFLLLSFFILTTKFKPAEAIAVTTPNSVAAKVAPDKDIVMITIDKDGKVFITMDDEQKKEAVCTYLNTNLNLNMNVAAFKKAGFYGAPFSSMASFLSLPEEQRKGDKLPGIPVLDSTDNQMNVWMRAIKDAYLGSKMNLLVKGDNAAKYPAFKAVIDAFKKNDELKFQMITNPESVPAGTELWKKTMAGEKREE